VVIARGPRCASSGAGVQFPNALGQIFSFLSPGAAGNGRSSRKSWSPTARITGLIAYFHSSLPKRTAKMGLEMSQSRENTGN